MDKVKMMIKQNIKKSEIYNNIMNLVMDYGNGIRKSFITGKYDITLLSKVCNAVMEGLDSVTKN